MSFTTSKLLTTAIACSVCASAASAATISLDQPSVEFSEAAGQTGTLQVLIDVSPENFTFEQGSVGISVASSTPGVIEITSAEVFAPEFFGGFAQRWSEVSVVGLTSDGIDELFGLSIQSAGLDTTLPGNADGPSGTFIFAEIEYTVVGEGSTTLSLAPITSRAGTFLVDTGTNVTGDISLSGSTITVVPEPTSLALLGLGGLMIARRRRG